MLGNRIGLWVAASFLCAVSVGADTRSTAAQLKGEWLDRSTSLACVQVDLDRMLKGLGKGAGVDFVSEPAVQVKVTFDMHNMPARRILELIEQTQNVAYRQDGNRILVSKASPNPAPPSHPAASSYPR
jgi:hypothetical protein